MSDGFLCFPGMVESTGMLYLPLQVQRKGRDQAVAMLTRIPSQMCGSMAQDYILLSPL